MSHALSTPLRPVSWSWSELARPHHLPHQSPNLPVWFGGEAYLTLGDCFLGALPPWGGSDQRPGTLGSSRPCSAAGKSGTGRTQAALTAYWWSSWSSIGAPQTVPCAHWSRACLGTGHFLARLPATEYAWSLVNLGATNSSRQKSDAVARPRGYVWSSLG